VRDHATARCARGANAARLVLEVARRLSYPSARGSWPPWDTQAPRSLLRDRDRCREEPRAAAVRVGARRLPQGPRDHRAIYGSLHTGEPT
jgi:hypothetical protein